ncbi:anthranilate phosphoribosyltransferase [Kamptonema cortianum]|nr:anthranilate phosphoribosyltransferase [Kamptonema cortianum]
MQTKGVTGEELAGFARGMRSHALQLDFGIENLVDTCGTGGGASTFNLSTGAAILAAACGAKVAKHGNRAVTSHCGSADVLEALGVPLESDEAQHARRLEECNLVFLFAPSHHPAVRHVAPVRKALGIRTFFNLLGPLANPAGAKRQIVGVFDKEAVEPVAQALQLLGAERAFVVHAHDGLDEVSPCAPTSYIEVRGEFINRGTWNVEDFGMSPLPGNSLEAASDIPGNAEILRDALSHFESGRSEALVPNTAVTLVLAGVADNVTSGAEMARNAIRSGLASNLLAKLCGDAS